MQDEQAIIDYLETKYHPEVIILEGSRASDNYRENSDWDLYVFVKDKTGLKGDWTPFNHHILDINLRNTPNNGTYIISNGYSPSKHVRVLKDNEQQLGKEIVEYTQKAREAGPLSLTTEDYESWKVGLKGIMDKISTSIHEPVVCFYPISNLYNRSIQFWFEIRNEWTLHPKEAIPYIQKKDPEFYSLLEALVTSSDWSKKVETSKAIYARLFPD